MNAFMNYEMRAWELAGIEGWTGYDSQTNQIRSASQGTPPCIHGRKCPLCSIGLPLKKFKDVDLGPDVDG